MQVTYSLTQTGSRSRSRSHLGLRLCRRNRAAPHRRPRLSKAELSSRWKGGFEAGDHVSIGDRRLEVIGQNVNNGKLVLADVAELDAEEIKQAAYDGYKASLSDAWRTHPTADSDAEPTAPLSAEDGEFVDGQSIKDAARREYEDALVNAWRKP